ncbi:MAG: SAM-dependent methyltransferase [Bacteroidales bacterium]|nr:SAM-dependent methyltransferase [Bacteroidales bacterium]
MQGSLYLIPVTLGDTPIARVLPSFNREIIVSLQHFIVENERTARRFLKKTEPSIDINSLIFYPLNKHTSPEEISSYLNPIESGFSVGLLSEAGCPAIADPGSDIVAIAQKKNIRTVPLVGPSSILLSLMASGFNGQSFAFHGYLPIEASQRLKAIKRLEQRIYTENQTQLFIETPYRNHKLIEELIKNCQPSTKLCIAANITCEDEWIKTFPVKQWSHQKFDLSKTPTIFLLYK